MQQRAIICLIVFAVITTNSQPISADVGVAELSADRLSIRINSQWVGGAHGGYLPIRIRGVNSGDSRQLTFRLKSLSKEVVPVITKTIQADQNTKFSCTLSVPLVGTAPFATFEVLDENGDLIKGLQQTVTLPPSTATSQATYIISVLVISETSTTNARSFEQAIQAVISNDSAHAHFHSSEESEDNTTAYEINSKISRIPREHTYHQHGHRPNLSLRHVSPIWLPESWIDYTAVDIVIADLTMLSRLSRPQFSAVLKWVQCGGTLIVRNVGDPPEKSKTLSRLLQPKQQAATETHSTIGRWQKADVDIRNDIQTISPIVFSGERFSALPKKNHLRWGNSGNAFVYKEELLGMIIAFSNDPFIGTCYDWLWLLETMKPSRYFWPIRYGISAREPSGSFSKFEIPGVKKIPVWTFLLLMTFFTIVIGPLNYFLLRKRKQLFLLLLTIPVIACVTSLSLFGYSIFSYGFSVKTRIRSFTILDQRNKIAVTTSREALFTGLAPSAGLTFSPETAVFPIWPANKNFEAGTIDWTEAQHLKTGWLHSRTHTQFFTTTHHTERSRLEIGQPKNKQLKVTNGFTEKIAILIVADANGTIYYGNNLDVNQSLDLKLATQGTLSRLSADIRQQAVYQQTEVPTHQHDDRIFEMRNRYSRRKQTIIGFKGNQMEQRIQQLQNLNGTNCPVTAKTYLAIFEKSPCTDIGVKETENYGGFHMVFGYY